VSYSVLTHLTRDAQIAWLEELRRLLRPGGLVLASVNGEFAASFSHAEEIRSTVRGGAISDSFMDATLDGIAPPRYYRRWVQPRAYTGREFGRVLRIVEYRERVLSNLQDLVVMTTR